MSTIRSMLKRRNAPAADVNLESGLYDDLLLDSLDVAELSVSLEDNMGSDPYSEGIIPRTVGEIVEFYDQ